MRRCLLVGCGGSGGATLQFVIDQLRAELTALGFAQVPQGWQFVHVDVPQSPDGVGPGYPPTLLEPPGRYIAMATTGATYPNVAEVVDHQLKDEEALAELATWRPRPEEVSIPIQNGAGQYRAVGRVLTLARAAAIRSGLESAVQALAGPEATQSLQRIADLVSPHTRAQVQMPPLIIVVSSMAGGAGASMALDVCRLLSQVQNVDARQVSLFLYTAEVFRDLPPDERAGVEANCAAMIGELLAAQSGAAAAADRRILAACGVDSSSGPDVPFRRVIPIGANVGGDGARFGDGTRLGIYRGIGRGLAALMMSGVATNRFLKAAIENAAGSRVDRTMLGWGTDPDALLWGSFGFASVGLGRDRYAEYAAQRLSRVAVDRLVAGHIVATDRRSPDDQMTSLVNDALLPSFSRALNLPEPGRSVKDWFYDYLRGLATGAAASTILQEEVAPRIPHGVGLEVNQVVDAFADVLRDSNTKLRGRVDKAATRWAFDWYQAARTAAEQEASDIVADHGLPAVRVCLERVRDALGRWAADLERSTATTRPDLAAPAPDSVAPYRGKRTKIGPEGGPAGQLLADHAGLVERALIIRFAELLAKVFDSAAVGLIQPLRDAYGDAWRSLEAARNQPAKVRGQALLHTEEYAAWPSGEGSVPNRFSEAHNEVLLTSAGAFEEEFRGHIQRSVQSVAFEASLDAIVGAVLRGRWETQGGHDDEFPMLEPRQQWWPGVFREDPTAPAGARTLVERHAAYHVSLRPADVLSRARAFVAVRNRPFSLFIDESLRGYLAGPGLQEAERSQRNRQVAAAFLRAVELSRPLVSVNAQTVQTLHGVPVAYHHTFTEIPFGDLEAGESLLQELRRATDLLPQTADSFVAAATDAERSPVKRVSIFGSYPTLSPAVFVSMLKPVSERWRAASAIEKAEFWKLRRTRRLPGFLPVGDAMRRALIGGWYAGRLVGLVRFPEEYGGRNIQVYDVEEREWVNFPHPLLTPQSRQRIPLDRLAAVLETMPIALAQCHSSPTLQPLKPYALLRGIFDSSLTEPERSGADIEVPDSLRQVLGLWIQRGLTESGLLPDPAVAGAPDDEPQERRKQVLATLASLRTQVAAFLPVHEGGAGGEFSKITTLGQLQKVPLFDEIAGDAQAVLDVLEAAASTWKNPIPQPF